MILMDQKWNSPSDQANGKENPLQVNHLQELLNSEQEIKLTMSLFKWTQ